MTGFPLQSWFRRLSPVAHRRGRLAALAGRVEKLRDEKAQLEALEIVPGRHQRLLTPEREPTTSTLRISRRRSPCPWIPVTW